MDVSDNFGMILLLVDSILAVMFLIGAFVMRKKDPSLSKGMVLLGVLFGMLPVLMLLWWLAAAANDPY